MILQFKLFVTNAHFCLSWFQTSESSPITDLFCDSKTPGAYWCFKQTKYTVFISEL